MSASAPQSPRSFDYVPPQSPLSVIYVDDNILVLDKPAGLLTVPGKTADLADCLEARAQAEFPSARIVHRLDKDTSGLIVLGLTAEAHAHLGLQFEKRQTQKTYAARIWGRPAADLGVIDEPMIADWPHRPRQKICHTRGRKAVTAWRVLQWDEKTTLVELKPQTGRSHQLRVHMLHLGHPILGDNIYAHDSAFKAANRLMLHAEALEISHPQTGTRLSFNAARPF